jgi:uncharacterized membrane protein SpoIIM required for sporulation
MSQIEEFISRRSGAWQELTAIVGKAGTRRGVKNLSRTEIQKLGWLYRRAAADLAYARLRGANPVTLTMLSDVVFKAHGLIYGDRGPGAVRMGAFLKDGFPSLIRKRGGYVFLAGLSFVLGGVLGGVLAATDPRVYNMFVGEMPPDYYQNMAKAKEGENSSMAAMLMTHNTQVGFIAFAIGIFGGLPALFPIFMTGLGVGAIAVMQHRTGHDIHFWSFIAPHATPELMAIFIAAAAGMRIGHVAIAPGELRRRDAITVAAQEAIRLVIGTIPFFVVAGLTEGFISPSTLPPVLKFIYGTMMLIIMTFYLSRRKKHSPI